MTEKVLDLVNGGAFPQTDVVVQKAADPAISNVATPVDFAAQFPQPLDTLEIIAMCEEISMWKAIPDKPTDLQAESWRELNALQFTSGSAYIAFADGLCPEEYTHNGQNLSVILKNIGAKKSLTLSDIKHSIGSIAAGYGINALLGAVPAMEGAPGESGANTFIRQGVGDLKMKEVTLAETLVMNGWDRLLVQGDATSRPLEFDGIEHWAANRACAFNTNDSTASGTFSSTDFDRFLMEGCIAETHVFGHPAAIQEMMSAYFALGAASGPQQTITLADGNRIVPGFNFAGFVNTARGRMTVIADNNFARTNVGGGRFRAVLYALRMTHNGEQLVYKINQFPLSMQDLTPGCTAISFEIWAKTALVIKHCCAHGAFTSYFTGRIQSTCPVIG